MGTNDEELDAARQAAVQQLATSLLAGERPSRVDPPATMEELLEAAEAYARDPRVESSSAAGALQIEDDVAAQQAGLEREQPEPPSVELERGIALVVAAADASGAPDRAVFMGIVTDIARYLLTIAGSDVSSAATFVPSGGG